MDTRYVWMRGPSRPSTLKQLALLASVLVMSTLLAGACDLRGLDDNDQEADIEVINSTGATLVTLQFKRSRDNAWGIDELRGLTIAPGDSFVIRDVEESETFDIRASDVDGFEYALDVHVSHRDESVTMRASDLVGGVGELWLRNETGSNWNAVHVTDRNAPSWGSSLSKGPIGPGVSIVVPREIWRTFNVRIVGTDNAVYELIDLPMNAKTKVVPVGDVHRVTDGRISVVNAIDYGNGGDNSLIAVFFRASGTSNWGADQLPGAVANGQEAEFELAPATYDVRVVDVSGQTYQQLGLAVIAGWPLEVRVVVGDAVPQP